MKKHLLRFSTLCLLLMLTVVGRAGENDLTWDYTENAPSENPDNGLYYGSKVNDAAGTNNGLKGVKLNSTGYAYFAKAGVAGKLTLTIGKRSGSGDFCVDVYACTITDGQADTENMKLIATTDAVQESNPVSVDIPADVTGIYVKRNTPSEGVLSKIVFKEAVARAFTNFEITNEQMSGTFDPSTLPAGVTFTGTQRNDSHGYGNVTLVVPVDGTVKFTIGGCQYANPANCKVTNAAGTVLAEPVLKTPKCYHQGGEGSTVTYIYVGDPTTLTFSDIAYLPYFKAEATEVSEVTITYKDQNGKVLGTKTVFEGDAIGEIPYTEKDLTIEEGYKFRGWVYNSGVKVKATDAVNSNTTVKASVTAIESATVGSIQNYDLTQNTFYPEDHETISTEGGAYYNNHGWDFAAEGSFTVDVAGKAQVVLTLCQYGNGTTITVTDANGKVIRNDVPAKAETDGGTTSVRYDGPATKLTFKFAAQTYLHKITVYNVADFLEKDASGYYIVPAGDAASLILAILSASSEEGAKIFLPNGTYDLGEAVQTPLSGKNLSIIGEDMNKTIIVSAPPVSMEGLGKADLFTNTGEGLYLQDLTLKNALDYYGAGSAGRAPTLHDMGTKTINKNVKHLSYQDTYYSHKVGGLYYFEGGEMHGTVDYLCGNGKVYFNGVTIVNEKRSSATISANSELYVFNNCTVKNNADTYTFGRAWSDNPTCIYLNTTLEDPDRLAATRWNLSGINCDYSIAGEYGTKNAAGKDITPAENVVTFTKNNTTLNTILDASALTTYSIENVLGSWAAEAQQQTKQIDAPAAKFVDGKVTWESVEGATAYLLQIEGIGSWIATDNSITQIGDFIGDTFDPAVQTMFIRAANARGGFGPAARVEGTSAVAAVKTPQTTADAIYTLQGVRVDKPGKGLYIINGKKVIIK